MRRDDSAPLQERGGVLTSGTASFSSSMLACGSLVSRLPELDGLRQNMVRAIEWAKNAKSARGEFMFVGSRVDYALAEYGACKVHEVLGAKATAHLPEQIGHSQLFAIDKVRDVILCLGAREDPKTREVFAALSQGGFNTSPIVVRASSGIMRSLATCFHLQHLALALARRRGIDECAFLSDKARLKLSSKLIY